MTIHLNEDQQAASAKILDFVKTKQQDFMVLNGAAGVGKSTTITYILEHLQKDTHVCFTATTNKAVKVLRTMAAKKNLNVECITIHSLLGLSMQFKDGKETLKNGGKSQFGRFDLVVIDESSMVNSELLGFIHRAVNHSGKTQVLFIGDSNQLPPVGEKMSPVFAINNRVALTKVVRQALENPILKLCTDIRAEIDSGRFNLPKIESATNGKNGIHVMESNENFQAWMPSAFSHENFNDNYDRFRVVAWRNLTVNRFNDVIQKLRYPDLDLPFAIGEPVTFSKPLHAFSTNSEFQCDTTLGSGWDAILCSTEAEGVIEKVVQVAPFILKPNDEQIAKGFDFKPFVIDRYTAQVKMLDNDEVVSCAIAGDKVQLNAMLNFVSNHARNGSGNFSWFDFYRLQKYFAELRPAYSITTHKSQGSTYQNVFVDVNDIMSNPDQVEALRCLYVAVSRASENVIIKL